MAVLRSKARTALYALLARRNMTLAQVRPDDMETAFWSLQKRVQHATMTSTARMYALWQAVRYVHARRIVGDIVECGVWKGGSSMLAALTLQQVGDKGRTLWLYDTFSGMSAPSHVDGPYAQAVHDAGRDDVTFAHSPLSEVRSNMASTAWPDEQTRYVEGKVEDSIPATVPDRPIALLRLDTDWYESTRHELVHLYPLLAPGGVLIIDDYGYWQGARQAVDEWLASTEDPPLLVRVDGSGRVAVKPS